MNDANSVRSFLERLPDTLNCEYHNGCSYLVWKLLDESLSCGDQNEVNWSYYSHVLRSKNWRNEAYAEVLDGIDWKIPEEPVDNLHIGSSCNRQCFPIEKVYYCFTCTINPLYEICEKCFDKSKHSGHEYVSKTVGRPEGRVCHCGDTSAFKVPTDAFKCQNNLNNVPTSEFTSIDRDKTKLFNDILDYIIDVSIYIMETSYLHIFDDMNSIMGQPTNRNDERPGIYRQEQHELLDDSDFEFDVRSIDYQRVVVHDKVTDHLLTIVDFEDENEEWVLQVDSADCSTDYMELMSKISRILNKPKEYGASISEILQNGSRYATVVSGYNLVTLKRIYDRFLKQGIKLKLRLKKDVFKLDLIADLIDWMYKLFCDEKTSISTKNSLRASALGIWDSNLFTKDENSGSFIKFVSKINLVGDSLLSYNTGKSFPWFQPWKFTKEKNPVYSTILMDYDRNILETVPTRKQSYFKALHGSRFQYLLTKCFFNFSRINNYKLLKLISTMFSIADSRKKYLAVQYLDVYLTVLNQTVTSENYGFKSLMVILSQYTFQSSEISNIAVKNNFIVRTLKFAFSLMAVEPGNLPVYLATALPRNLKLPADSLKNRKTIISFRDLYILISSSTIPEVLLEDEMLMKVMFDCISQFNNILALKRETTDHVEFENYDFSSFYYFFPSILIMADSYIRSLSSVTDIFKRKELTQNLLNITMNNELIMWSNFKKSIHFPPTVLLNKIDPKEYESSVISETVCNKSSNVLTFKVGLDTQKFFNPMAYLFKFVLQWSQCGRLEPLSNSLKESMRLQNLLQDKTKNLYICDSSLSTLVLIGQIKIGFWVRNGAPIIHQMKMYTRNNMREYTYNSDLFNVQFSMTYSNPDDFMVTYLSRWGIKNWANGVPMNDYPEIETTSSIVNQAVLLLIQLLIDIKSLTMESSIDGFEKTLKSEIIHSLCFKSLTYKQLTAPIPDYITKHVAFDLHLSKYTEYQPPTGLTDSGVYKLKNEYLKEIDTFYTNLSATRRYEVERHIRNEIAKKKKISYDQTYLPARKVNDLLSSTPYENLFSISSVDTFGMFLKNSLDQIIKYNYDTLMSSVVHLIHLCVVNNFEEFMKIFWREYEVANPEHCHFHSIGSTLYSSLELETYSGIHGKIREIFRYVSETAPHINVTKFLQEQTPSFSIDVLWNKSNFQLSSLSEKALKKTTAKLRKEKLLKKLAKQQQQFLKSNDICNFEDFDTRNRDVCEKNSLQNAEKWSFMEDFCEFCKISQTDDVFVYFSYQEKNITDYGINFGNFEEFLNLISRADAYSTINIADDPKQSDLGTMASTKIKPVLRTCGHGAHVKCLANHMSSINSVHTQTTKNIPLSYGFGLLFCPLCNALSNCFLPRISNTQSRDFKEFLEDQVAIKEEEKEFSKKLLTATSIRSVYILQDLVYSVCDEKIETCDILKYLLVNTISNIELLSRITKNATHKVTNHKQLTIRLISELQSFLIRFGRQELENTKKCSFSWDQFISNELNANILVKASDLFCSSSSESTSDNTLKINDYIQMDLHQKFMMLIKEMNSVNFYDCYQHLLSKKCLQHLKEVNQQHSAERELVLLIAQSYIKLYNISFNKIEPKKFEVFNTVVYYLISNSLIVFLKRLTVLVDAFYNTNSSFISCQNDKIDHNEMNKLLKFFGIESFSSLLKDYLSNKLNNIMNLTKSEGFSKDSNNKIGRYSIIKKLNSLQFFESFKPPYLINLPKCLSFFSDNEVNRMIYRATRDEMAVCLLCGARMYAQRFSKDRKFRLGECTNHCRNNCTVSLNFGVFLLVKSNTLYLSYGNRGSFYPSAYLNRHGETDEEMKVNAPVYLDKKRYEHFLTEVVLGNEIPHIVFRLTEGNIDLGGWETI